MSTNSTIIKEVNDGYVEVYCHWDGYLEWNGAILAMFYNTQDKVDALFRAVPQDGYIRSLEPMLQDCDFNSGTGNGVQPKFDLNPTQEFMYVWRYGEWWYDTEDNSKGLRRVTVSDESRKTMRLKQKYKL